MDKVTITNPIRPPAPSGRELVTAQPAVVLYFNADLKCVHVKLEYFEIVGDDSIQFRTDLTGTGAAAFYTAWKAGNAAAVTKWLKKRDLRKTK